MKTMEANGQQTLLDIALQHCGAAEAVFAIAELNSISPDIVPCHGDIVNLPDVVNKKVVAFYASNGISPATAKEDAPEPGPEPVTYPITVAASEHGTATASAETAAEGTVITLTIAANTGYAVGSVTVTAGSETINVSRKYRTFVMPAADVTVEVEYILSAYIVMVGEISNGQISVSPSRATYGTLITVTPTPDDGYVLLQLTATALGGSQLELTEEDGGAYTFTMPPTNVTVTATFAQVQQEPKWRLVTSVPQDLSGEYILAGMDGDEGWMFAGNLANYQGEMAQVEVGDNGTSIKQTEAAGARLVTIGNRRLVDSGTYGGTFSYTIAYQHSVNGKRYMTYSSSGLSNSSSNSGTNSRWHIEIDSNGRMTAINIDTTRCRLYMYASQLEHYLAQAVATNHDSIDTAYKPLSLFALEE